MVCFKKKLKLKKINNLNLKKNYKNEKKNYILYEIFSLLKRRDMYFGVSLIFALNFTTQRKYANNL